MNELTSQIFRVCKGHDIFQPDHACDTCAETNQSNYSSVSTHGATALTKIPKQIQNPEPTFSSGLNWDPSRQKLEGQWWQCPRKCSRLHLHRYLQWNWYICLWLLPPIKNRQECTARQLRSQRRLDGRSSISMRWLSQAGSVCWEICGSIEAG